MTGPGELETVETALNEEDQLERGTNDPLSNLQTPSISFDAKPLKSGPNSAI